MKQPLELTGVFPANLLPFTSDLEIDEINYRKHLRYLAEVKGVSGIVTNGHAAEIASLNLAEQQRTIALALEEIAGRKIVISGVYADGTRNAVRIAKMAEQEGVDCLLVFPSALYDFGSQLRPEMAFRHIATIAESTSLPIIAFVYPVNSGLHITTENLLNICLKIDNVIAVKEWSNDITVYEKNYRELKRLNKKIYLLTSFSKALLASLCIGADGILSGHGSMIPELQVELFNAVKENNLEKARVIAEKIYPIVQLVYAPPFLDMHNRMKEALAMLGRIDAAYVRPPLQPISQKERERIRQCLIDTGLMENTLLV